MSGIVRIDRDDRLAYLPPRLKPRISRHVAIAPHVRTYPSYLLKADHLRPIRPCRLRRRWARAPKDNHRGHREASKPPSASPTPCSHQLSFRCSHESPADLVPLASLIYQSLAVGIPQRLPPGQPRSETKRLLHAVAVHGCGLSHVLQERDRIAGHNAVCGANKTPATQETIRPRPQAQARNDGALRCASRRLSPDTGCGLSSSASSPLLVRRRWDHERLTSASSAAIESRSSASGSSVGLTRRSLGASWGAGAANRARASPWHRKLRARRSSDRERALAWIGSMELRLVTSADESLTDVAPPSWRGPARRRWGDRPRSARDPKQRRLGRR